LISKNVVPHAKVVAPPTDDSRPRDAAEEWTARSATSRTGHPSGDDPGKRPQKCLERFSTPGANEQVQMGSHVGKVVDPDSEPLGHRSKRALHGGRMLAKRPRAVSPVARKNHVHRTPHADWALELATPTPHGAPMFRSHQLSLHVVGEKCSLHE
jgi:hypothetical protein